MALRVLSLYKKSKSYFVDMIASRLVMKKQELARFCLAAGHEFCNGDGW